MIEISSKFSPVLHGGQVPAEAALAAHEALLIPGCAVRVYRGDPRGFEGAVVEGEAPGLRCVLVSDGAQTLALETRNLEIVAA